MLIKKRFLNTKVKILTGVVAAGLVIGGSLLTLPTGQAKSVVSDDYPLNDSIIGTQNLFGVMSLTEIH